METGNFVLKVGCGKFIHGSGVVRRLQDEIVRLGGKALIVGGTRSMEVFRRHTDGLLDPACYVEMPFGKSCTVAMAEKIIRTARENQCNVLVAVGGGRCIDCVKCASSMSQLPFITVPTSIATCAATSIVAIMYNEKGQRAPAVKLLKEVDVCVADTDMIKTAPRRTLAAGILDSLAKYPESVHKKKIAGYADCDLKEYIQYVNAKAIFEFLLGEYEGIYNDYENAPRWDDFVLTNLLHTSIVSGFADGSGQLAVAHALYDFVRNHHTEPGEAYLHGELVAVGLPVQMVFNGQPAQEVDAVKAAMRAMGMPLTLKDIQYDVSKESVDFLVERIAADASITSGDEIERLRMAVREIV